MDFCKNVRTTATLKSIVFLSLVGAEKYWKVQAFNILITIFPKRTVLRLAIIPHGDRQIFIFTVFLLKPIKMEKETLSIVKIFYIRKTGVPAVGEDLKMKKNISVLSDSSMMAWKKFWWIVCICKGLYVCMSLCVRVCVWKHVQRLCLFY